MESQVLDLDMLLQSEVPVKFQNQSYILRQPTEAAVVKFRSAQLADAAFVDGKVQANIGQIQQSQSLLVSLCLIGPNGFPVPQDTILGWPSSVVRMLFDKLKEMGGLDEGKAGADAKVDAAKK